MVKQYFYSVYFLRIDDKKVTKVLCITFIIKLLIVIYCPAFGLKYRSLVKVDNTVDICFFLSMSLFAGV